MFHNIITKILYNKSKRHIFYREEDLYNHVIKTNDKDIVFYMARPFYMTPIRSLELVSYFTKIRNNGHKVIVTVNSNNINFITEKFLTDTENKLSTIFHSIDYLVINTGSKYIFIDACSSTLLHVKKMTIFEIIKEFIIKKR